MALTTQCSHCSYVRQFSPELGGRFFRCPKCRAGVLAVPRSSSDEARAWQSSHDAWIEESSTRIERASASGSGEGSVEAAIDEASEGPDHRGRVGPARKILVECGLCGYLVHVPPAFFGKTVHCPECAGDTVFTESTLEPVKDELLDRFLLESRERRALFAGPGEQEGGRWRLPDLRSVRSFAVGVALGGLLLFAGWVVYRLAAGD